MEKRRGRWKNHKKQHEENEKDGIKRAKVKKERNSMSGVMERGIRTKWRRKRRLRERCFKKVKQDEESRTRRQDRWRRRDKTRMKRHLEKKHWGEMELDKKKEQDSLSRNDINNCYPFYQNRKGIYIAFFCLTISWLVWVSVWITLHMVALGAL